MEIAVENNTMAKEKRETKKSEVLVVKPFIPESAAYLGMVLFIVGIAIMYLSSRAQQTAIDRVNYLGIAIAAIGCLLWFTSGMDRTQLFEWLRSGATALLLALMIRWAIAEPYRIPTGSMETTLHGDPRFGRGDRVFVNKWIYGLRYPFMNKRIWNGQAPQRWDVVVFKTVEENATAKTLVKRIVGMPGEYIQIRNGKIYANEEEVELSSALPADIFYTTPLDGPFGVQPAENFARVPEGHYLVLGDNSARSRDGRYFGWLPQEHIVGRVASIWWPPPRWRDFTGFSQTVWWRGILALLGLAVVLRIFALRLCPVHNPIDNNKIDHLVVSFAHYGFPVPFANKLLFRWSMPKRGDLVLYYANDPEGDNSHLLVGRVAGLPGEQVQIQGEVFTVNNEAISLPSPAPERYAGTYENARYGISKSKGYTSVPEGHYFILADETVSEGLPPDSRALGWISLEQISGRAVCCWWPLLRIGRR